MITSQRLGLHLHVKWLSVHVMRVVALCVIASVAVQAIAEVYKYKDANGNWQFSDKPPANGTAEKIDKYVTDDSVAPVDYQQLLQEKYRPQSEVEAATIAVVKVETPLGSGSGFFVTRSGYLVTNKHVVRPPALSKADREGKFKKSEAALLRARKNLSKQRARLQSAKRNLDDYTEYFNSLSDSERAELRSEFNRRKKNYASSKRDVKSYAMRIRDETKKMDDARNNYNRRHTNTMVARQFTVRLKDDTQLNAELVKTSQEYDLALLKVEALSVPHLPVVEKDWPRQGQEVFAIGSPLGNTDYVTSGIITSLKRDRIVIDAQILPGNSGGPLLNAEGVVIGVNTWKLLSSNAMASDGFGVAIPARRVLSEFSAVLDRELRAIKEENVIPELEAGQADLSGESPGASGNALRDAILRDYQSGQ